MYFSFVLVEVIEIIHIIDVTLLSVIQFVTDMLLLSPPLPHLSHHHVRYIVKVLIHGPLRRIEQWLKSGLSCLLLSN
jgi:hypothetical protein